MFDERDRAFKVGMKGTAGAVCMFVPRSPE